MNYMNERDANSRFFSNLTLTLILTTPKLLHNGMNYMDYERDANSRFFSNLTLTLILTTPTLLHNGMNYMNYGRDANSRFYALFPEGNEVCIIEDCQKDEQVRIKHHTAPITLL